MSDSGPYARLFIGVAGGGKPAASSHPLHFAVAIDDDGMRVTISGDVDENADFSTLRDELAGRVVMDLAGLRRFNSCGVREWVNFQRDLVGAPVELELHACSPAVVSQLNTISNFGGAARVVSFLAPYVCEACEREEQRLIEVAPDPRDTTLPAFACERCRNPLVFDDLADRYLSFLRG